MNCQTLRQKLAEYVGEMLPAADRDALSAHILGCTECTALVKPLRDLACREVIDSLADYLDGTMSRADSHSLALHLELCTECEDYLDAYQQTIRLAKTTSEPPCLDPPLPDALVRTVLAWRNRPPEAG